MQKFGLFYLNNVMSIKFAKGNITHFLFISERYADVISPVKGKFIKVKLFITWLWFLSPWYFVLFLRWPNAEIITNLENRKMIHLSMDGPSTNVAVLHLLTLTG